MFGNCYVAIRTHSKLGCNFQIGGDRPLFFTQFYPSFYATRLVNIFCSLLIANPMFS